MVSIHSLAERPGLIPTVASWHWDAWGHGDPDGSLAAWVDRLRRKIAVDAASATWVAIEDDQPVGCVALTRTDMVTHPELSPWLSALFVVQELRGRGLGTTLVRHCEQAGKARGFDRLYLYTTTAAGLYLNLGWHEIARERYGAEDVTTLAKNLVTM